MYLVLLLDALVLDEPQHQVNLALLYVIVYAVASHIVIKALLRTAPEKETPTVLLSQSLPTALEKDAYVVAAYIVAAAHLAAASTQDAYQRVPHGRSDAN